MLFIVYVCHVCIMCIYHILLFFGLLLSFKWLFFSPHNSLIPTNSYRLIFFSLYRTLMVMTLMMICVLMCVCVCWLLAILDYYHNHLFNSIHLIWPWSSSSSSFFRCWISSFIVVPITIMMMMIMIMTLVMWSYNGYNKKMNNCMCDVLKRYISFVCMYGSIWTKKVNQVIIQCFFFNRRLLSVNDGLFGCYGCFI